MTKPSASTTPTSPYLALLDDIQALLAEHPAGGRVKLMLVPPELELQPGEVLVQHASSAGYELRPHQLMEPGAPQPPTIDPGDAGQLQAAVGLVSQAWTAVLNAGGLHPGDPQAVHLPGLFDPRLLQALRLPIGEQRSAEQPVSFVQPGRDEELHTDAKAIVEAYTSKPRTRIYFAIEERAGGPWSLAALLLSQLAGYRVVCSMYESRAGDAKFDEHRDDWYGVIIQIKGAKQWRVPAGRQAGPSELTLRAGDALLLPRGVAHAISTPEESLHVNFAVLTATRPIRDAD
jgi:hypothetical protein